MVTSRKTSRTSASAAKADKPAFGDIGKLIEQFKLPGIDVQAIVESQRKDMDALAEANRLAYEGIKALAERRDQILKESLMQWQEAMQDVGGKDALAKQADLAKKGVQKAMANMRELAEMEAASRSKAWKVVQQRFQENLANLQKLLQPK